MNIFSQFHAHIAVILNAMIAKGRLPQGLDMQRFGVEPPRDSTHGDLSANAAMVFAKESKASFANPRQLATEIAFALTELADVDQAEVAGPGFINIRLKAHVLQAMVRAAIEEGADFGRIAAQGNKVQGNKVNVEFVSANPTGPMHVGHGRGAVFGDALAGLPRRATRCRATR